MCIEITQGVISDEKVDINLSLGNSVPRSNLITMASPSTTSLHNHLTEHITIRTKRKCRDHAYESHLHMSSCYHVLIVRTANQRLCPDTAISSQLVITSHIVQVPNGPTHHVKQ